MLAEPSKWVRPEQIRAARALLGLSGRDFAAAAGVGTATLNRYETGAAASSLAVAKAVRGGAESLGARFIDASDGESYGVMVDPALLPPITKEGLNDLPRRWRRLGTAASVGVILLAATTYLTTWATIHTPSVVAFQADGNGYINRVKGIQSATERYIQNNADEINQMHVPVRMPVSQATCDALTAKAKELASVAVTESDPRVARDLSKFLDGFYDTGERAGCSRGMMEADVLSHTSIDILAASFRAREAAMLTEAQRTAQPR